MPRNSIAKKKFDLETGIATFAFSNGEEINVALKDLPEAVVNYATGHGLLQGLGDAYSSAKSPEEGMAALNSRITKWQETGVWATRGSGSGSARLTILHRALFAITENSDDPKTMEDISGLLEEKSDEEKKELKKHPQVKAAIAKINAQEATRKAKEAAKDAGSEEVAPLSF